MALAPISVSCTSERQMSSTFAPRSDITHYCIIPILAHTHRQQHRVGYQNIWKLANYYLLNIMLTDCNKQLYSFMSWDIHGDEDSTLLYPLSYYTNDDHCSPMLYL
jgi:hypothetical protein